MPETRLEWFVLVLGGCVVGLLGFLIVKQVRHESRPSAARPPAVAARRPAPTTTAAVNPGGPIRRATALPPLATFALTATRGNCWGLVRDGSPTALVLYSGVIARGDTKIFRARKLWLRLGAASNVVAHLNGKRVTLPPGTPTLAVTTKEVRTLSLG